MTETATSVPLSSAANEHTSAANPQSCMKDYDVKWISWNGKKTATIMQNLNGPCPMIALINVLLLSNRIKLRNRSSVSSEHLLEQLGDLLLQDKEMASEEEQLNYERNIADVITIFPKLLTGIDVNIQFKNVNSFELTPELTVFDAFSIDLFHGWLPDPQMEDDYRVVSGESYNQLVDKIITSKTSTEENSSPATTAENSEDRLVQEGLICENFLDSYPTQLTYHGLVTIYEKMSNNQLAVFFRNNHFSTIYKYKEELFTLVTDRGYLNKSSIVWETLSVTGDTHFTDGQFMTSPTEPDDDDLSAMNVEASSQQQSSTCSEQLDRQLALELDRKLNPPRRPAATTRPRPAAGTADEQQHTTTVANRTRRNSSSKCVIT